MVTMVRKRKYLINFTFYDIFKEEPIPHKNFTLLGQGSHEISGVRSAPPPPPPPVVSDVGTKTLGNRRVKVSRKLKSPPFQVDTIADIANGYILLQVCYKFRVKPLKYISQRKNQTQVIFLWETEYTFSEFTTNLLLMIRINCLDNTRK